MSFLYRWLKLSDRTDTPAKRVRHRKRAKARTRGQLLLEQLEVRAVPAFGLNSLRLGATNGPTDYLYTTGNTIVPTGSVDRGKFYDIVVTDSNNLQRTVVGRTSGQDFSTTNNS